jgi:hypothetical protein
MKTFSQYITESTMKRIHERMPVKSFDELNRFCVAASQKHKDAYILASVIFGEATVYATDRLPTSAYASDDWKLGYWRNGKHHSWSDARKRRAQRAVDKLSGLQ